MEKQKLTAVNFIKTKQERHKYECGVCTEVCVKPVRCKGDCKRVYCMKCVSDIRQVRDICPYKCSEPFLVEKVPGVNLEFYCPFAAT